MTTNQDAEWLGVSNGMAALREEMQLCSESDGKVLISGDSGVDTELIARAIHDRSRRAGATFTRVNCAGLIESELESRLFGHVAGSHGGAVRDRAGAIETGDGGSVFLNQVGELTPRLQRRLLDFLETSQVRRVGAPDDGRRVNVRLLAATGRNLIDRVHSGWFREDLFYRLNLIHIVVPPLSERREDVPVLVEFFLRNLATARAGHAAEISPAAMTLLREYSWPGNVRELRMVMEQLVGTAPGIVAEVDDLPARIRLGQRRAGVGAAAR